MKSHSVGMTVVLVALTLTISSFASPVVSASTVPQFNPQAGSRLGPAPEIGSYTCSSSSPCPMGVADYGVNGGKTYSYNAQEFSSWVNFTKLAIGGSGQISVQQNTVAYKVHEFGKSDEYWIQDVPRITQTSAGHYSIQFLDNIWNFSAPGAKMSGTIFPNLDGLCSSHGGAPTYYYCIGKESFATTLPFELNILVRTGIVTSGTYTGHAAVSFAIFVYHSGASLGGAEFDAVAFGGKTTVVPSFHVGGKNPYGLFNDAETVLGGFCCGSTIKITSVSAHITESYSTTLGGTFTKVSHAWSAGANTAETVSGVQMKSATKGTGIAFSGTDNNVQLW